MKLKYVLYLIRITNSFENWIIPGTLYYINNIATIDSIQNNVLIPS